MEITVARLEERLAAAEEIKIALRGQIEELKARLAREEEQRVALEHLQTERDRRLDEVLRQFSELRARPPRRPWPGLKSWWRRAWEGERGP